jgi:hypothetical protein
VGLYFFKNVYNTGFFSISLQDHAAAAAAAVVQSPAAAAQRMMAFLSFLFNIYTMLVATVIAVYNRVESACVSFLFSL